MFGTLEQLMRNMRDARDLAFLRLNNVARDVGILRGHSDYTRFIVLGRSRIGSNFLGGLLNSHKRILAYGEVFARDDTVDWGLAGHRVAPKHLASVQRDPVDFLNTYVYGDAPEYIQAVGFKIFYYHAQNAQRQPIWNYLAERPGLKVIHLKRRNVLRTLLSAKRAQMTGQWIKQSSGREEVPPVTIDYEECLEAFTNTRNWENEYDHFFANQEMLTVYYETLVDNCQTEMARVQNFLGVEIEDVKARTLRQGVDSLPDSILNYYELAERFAGTEWQSFFDE